MSSESTVRERLNSGVKKAPSQEVPEEKPKSKSKSATPAPQWNQLALCASNDAPLGVFRPIMIALEISCHGLLWLIATITMLMCIHKPHHIQIVFNLLIGLIADLLVVFVIKSLVQRQRPLSNHNDMVATISVDRFSFPSGHATRAFYLTFFIAKQMPEAQKLVTFTAVWAVFVCISRLLLGRHHISDVLFGSIIGIIEFYTLDMLWISRSVCSFFLSPFFGSLV
ncbi:phospholipid phosphatase 6-like isoform X1 [Argonauta hians]